MKERKEYQSEQLFSSEKSTVKREQRSISASHREKVSRSKSRSPSRHHHRHHNNSVSRDRSPSHRSKYSEIYYQSHTSRSPPPSVPPRSIPSVPPRRFGRIEKIDEEDSGYKRTGLSNYSDVRLIHSFHPIVYK